MTLYHIPSPRQQRMAQFPDQKIVIFDSPDGTGKTTIAQALSLDLKVPYFRMTTQHENWRKGKFKEALEFDQTYISQFLLQTGHSAVIDRAFPSEWVYSKVFKRKTNEKVLEQLDREFALMGTQIVIPLRHDYSTAREDEVVSKEMLLKIHDVYVEFIKWTHCRCIALYVDELEEKLVQEIRMIKDEFMWDHGCAPGINGNSYRESVILDRTTQRAFLNGQEFQPIRLDK